MPDESNTHVTNNYEEDAMIKDFWYKEAPLQGAQRNLRNAQTYQNQYEKFAIEFANIQLSHTWLITQDSRETAQLLIDYAEACASYLLEIGHNLELVEWCNRGLNACALLEQSPHQLNYLLGKAQNALGRWKEAEQSFQDAIKQSTEIDPSLCAQATVARGRLLFNQGNYTVALEILGRAEQMLINRDNSSLLLAEIYSERAAYYMNRRELDQALSEYLKVDQLLKETSGINGHTANFLMLGVVYRKQKNYQKALEYLNKSLEIGEEQQRQIVASLKQNKLTQNQASNHIATVYHHLAWTYFEQGDTLQARDYCDKAIDLYSYAGDDRGQSDAFEQLGCIYLGMDNAEEAVIWLQKSLKMREILNNRQGIASSHSKLSKAYLKKNNMIRALWNLYVSIIIYLRIGVLSRQRLMLIAQQILLGLKK